MKIHKDFIKLKYTISNIIKNTTALLMGRHRNKASTVILKRNNFERERDKGENREIEKIFGHGSDLWNISMSWGCVEHNEITIVSKGKEISQNFSEKTCWEIKLRKSHRRKVPQMHSVIIPWGVWETEQIKASKMSIPKVCQGWPWHTFKWCTSCTHTWTGRLCSQYLTPL